MKKYGVTTKRQLSTLALGCALVASTALALVNCTDPASPATYTVTFNMDGGEPAVKDKTVENGKLLAKPSPDPTKTGYSFAGWYSDQALTQAFNFNTDKITANTTLYAKWNETYTVTFDSNGGTNVDQQTVETGKKASQPTDPIKPEYTFENWYSEEALATLFDFDANTITQNITLYAKWTPKTYTVTFNPNNGEDVTSQSVAYGSVVPTPENPTKADSTFAGWFKDRALTQAFDFSADKITANTTLYAKWVSEGTTVTYTVTFDTNGGEPAIAANTIEAGKTLEKPSPDPTKTDSLFVGWYNDEALTQAFNFFANTITATITLYAKWVPEKATATYTVAFDLNGGTPNEEAKTVAHGEKVQRPQPDPTKTDSLFAGWYKDEELTQRFPFSTERITQPITLYAKWEAPTGVTIPDANFRARLKAVIFGVFEGEKLDVTSDKVTRRTTLSISSLGIKDLTGIEYFTALTKLYGAYNQLAALDVSKNTQLTLLDCDENSLTVLDVSKNTQLTNLNCRNNRLTALDVSKNTQLTLLDCDENSLTVLDVSKNTQLTTLSCYNNSLTHLDIRGMRSATQLNIHSATGETNAIDTLKVHEHLKDHEQIKKVKTARGDKVTIETYSAAATSTQYMLVCSDYDPTAGNEADRCGDEVKYTVTFNSHGGSLVNPILLYRESSLLKPTNPTKGDFTFAGWYNDEALSQAFDFDTETITADITLHAKWIIVYTVAFNLNGGTPNEEDKIVEAGTLLTQPHPHPTKEYNTFAGWYNDEALTQRFQFSTEKITADITLYAQWTPIAYTVTFNLNGGSPEVTDKTVEAGKLLEKPSPDPTKTDSVFTGWYNDQALTQAFNFATEKITQHSTLYAKWEAPTGVTIPDVNFRKKLQALIPGAFVGEKLNATSDEVTGLKVLSVQASSIEDLTGIHYFTALTQLYCYSNSLTSLDVSKNTALTALDCSRNRLVSLDVSKNTALTALDCSSNSLTSLDVSKNTRLGVLGCSSNSLTSLDVSVNTGLTRLLCQGNQLTHLDIRGMRSSATQLEIYAATGETNMIDTLKVHENLQDHAQINALKTARGDRVNIETYSAGARSTEYTLVCSDYDPTADREADRCGDEVRYTVVFNSNGGSLVDSLYLYYEGTISKPTDPTRTGFLFGGWYNDETLTQAFNFSADKITANTTLHARWVSEGTMETYTVTFSLNGGSSDVENTTVEIGETLEKPSPDPTKTDSVFAGWYKDEELTQRFQFSTEKITADITLYAKWEAPTGVTIPDANFRKKLQALIPGAFEGELLNTKSTDVTGRLALDVNFAKIQSLEGIHYFTGLISLTCQGNQLTDLDVSKNTQLTNLNCEQNQLDSLDVSKNTRLITLDCSSNLLGSLDVSKNTALNKLYCSSDQLGSLDVSNNTALTELYCGSNLLDSLDVSKNTRLTTLNCPANSLAKLDVSNNKYLARLSCNDNQLTDLDVSKNGELEALSCNNNQLDSLDVSKNRGLTILECNNNQLTRLDMRGMRSATQLNIHSATGETNVIDTLKVHEALQDHAQINAVKTARGDEVTIETYSAAEGSITYTLVCSDYDPTADDGTGGKGVCNDAP